MEDFRLRQVHLDFHTSPDVPSVGDKFNKEEWQKALKEGHVDSITVFSKCHHGYSYHPSEVNEMHPKLSFDLLGAQLEACREIGVRAPVYISAGYDEKDALEHPDWLQRTRDDQNLNGTFMIPRFHLMCFNTPYLDKLIAEIDEVMRRYDPCGIFLDILEERVCCCSKCRADMTAMGLDYTNEEDAREFGRLVYRRYLDAVEKTVRKYSKTATIFHNSGHVIAGRRDLIDTDTHLELESLPTGGWSYDHFPMSAAYARTLGKDFLGMTGKFHKSWGEFGGFKHPNALIYEAALSIALGAGCSIGDQMHPEGRLNPATFRLIGKAYSHVEECEPWCRGAKNIADIAVFSNESVSGVRFDEKNKADEGANRILLETHRVYDFVDAQADLSKYKLLILPDYIRMTPELKAKVDAFLAAGGKLLLSAESGLDENDRFVFDTGVRYLGKNKYAPNYYIPGFDTLNGTTEYVMRAQSYLFENEDAEAVSYAQDPYFNRTPQRFCSHQHAPNNRDHTYVSAVIKGNIAYIGWDIFAGYRRFGDYHIKELVDHIIKRLMGDGFSATASLPDRGVMTLTQQGERRIVHLLYAHTTVRGVDTEVIEDIVPVYGVDVSVKADKPSSVTLEPQGERLDFSYANGRVTFTVPKTHIHQIVCIE